MPCHAPPHARAPCSRHPALSPRTCPTPSPHRSSRRPNHRSVTDGVRKGESTASGREARTRAQQATPTSSTRKAAKRRHDRWDGSSRRRESLKENKILGYLIPTLEWTFPDMGVVFRDKVRCPRVASITTQVRCLTLPRSPMLIRSCFGSGT